MGFGSGGLDGIEHFSWWCVLVWMTCHTLEAPHHSHLAAAVRQPRNLLPVHKSGVFVVEATPDRARLAQHRDEQHWNTIKLRAMLKLKLLEAGFASLR